MNCIFPKNFKEFNNEQNFINVVEFLVNVQWQFDINMWSFVAVHPVTKTKTRGGLFPFYVNQCLFPFSKKKKKKIRELNLVSPKDSINVKL